MPAEAPYDLDSAVPTSPEALSSLSSQDISLPLSTGSSSASGPDKPSSFSPSSVPHNLRPTTLNATKEMYWFAHTGEPSPKGPGSEGEGSPVRHQNGEDPTTSGAPSPDSAKATAARGALSPGQHSESYWFAHAGDYDTTTPSVDLASDSGFSESKEDSLAQIQRDRELRLRQYKEIQEEERLRRLSELQNASLQAQRYREQQEEDRRRKIDELRSKDMERRHAVEERKRLIWEAEQERKESILRRNLEREAKIEAKRNAQRNTSSIAFGSATPREIDLPTGTTMTASRGSSFGSMVAFPSVTPHLELYKKRTPSADVLDKKSDLSNHESPEVQMRTRDTESPSSQYNRRSFAGMSSEGARACLTIPEYSHSHYPSYSSLQAHDTDVWLFGSGVSDPMTRSLVILPSNRGRRKTDLTPTIPWERESALRSQSPGNIGGTRSQAKRAVSMSRLDILAQPRRRPSANMDQAAIGAPSTGNSSSVHKDSYSPSRPRSSQSMASELSAASTVSMRSHSGPRRARPISIAGSVIPLNPEAGHVQHPLPPQRRSRTAERKGAAVPPTRPPRAKSIGPDVLVPVSSPKATHTPAPRKPPLAPKPGSAPSKMAKETEPSESESAQSMDQEAVPEAIIPEAPPTTQPEVSPVEAGIPPVAEAPKTEEAKEGPVTTGKAPRITSEEEAKAALAEKRRLAREQAEREAELERQRQEELRRQEEERIRLEEEEQRRQEEEQLRLAQQLRQQEEEKLRKAIEEQQKKEEEEKMRREEEVKLRLEKEEQERKLREEAEKQRKELEEKLKQEEAARAERKKRVEQIMKRTRTKNEDPLPKDDKGGADNESENVGQEVALEVEASIELLETSQVVTNVPQLEEDASKVNGVSVDSVATEQNGFQEDFVILQNGVSGKATSNSQDVSPQTNGYSSHDVSFGDISPEEKPQPDLGPLLDFDLVGGSERGPPPPPTEFDQLIDLSLGVTNQNEMNRLNNADDLNSNRVPSNPFIAFEENVTRKQESALTDLLS